MMAADGTSSNREPISIALDTDIGSDVDDLLAIAVILGSPELSVSAVTTVYGDVDLRARIAARAFAAAGRAAPPITPGRATTRSGREVWWAGHEGATMANLGDQSYSPSPSAIDDLAHTEHVVTIGPLTNLAEALEQPGHGIREITMMGGAFDGRTEHNIRSDVAAADVVFRSGVEITTVGVEQTERVGFSSRELSGLGGELGRTLEGEARHYWKFTEQDRNTPHDPIAILMLTSPQLFRFDRGHISVETTGADEGLTRFRPDPEGRHRVVRDLDVDAVEREIEKRLRAACR
jgi:purine nucleosidase